LAVAQAYANDRENIRSAADRITAALNDINTLSAPTGDARLSGEPVEKAAAELARSFDPRWGGFGPAPKFPPPASSVRLLLRRYNRTKDKRVLRMVTVTLQGMAGGGIYDHLGGGFHRYSVDERWLVPHFEKMLYDNAQLAVAYAEAYQVTGKRMYLRVVRETLDYVLREMTATEGGFFSSQDADSEGEEGKFYVWTAEQIDAELGEQDGALLRKYYGVTAEGNFEGKNILHIPVAPEEFAAKEGLDPKRFAEKIDRLKGKLFEARRRRPSPATDDKILADWNALMITAFARGYRLFGDEKYRRAAVRAAEFILKRMRNHGRLLHAYRGGARVLRDLAVPGRDAAGIHFAMDFLVQNNRRLAGESIPEDEEILATGKRVVIIGGGDTGNDCLGTALRQDAAEVRQIELLDKPPEGENPETPWPKWPLILRTSTSHEEGGSRDWSVATKAFKTANGRVVGLECQRVKWTKDAESGRIRMEPVPSSDFEIEADLVLLAMGFPHPTHEGLLDGLGVAYDARGNVATDDHMMTSVDGVFTAGDMQTGAWLVVGAIAGGRRMARHVDLYLMNESALPDAPPLPQL